jgi:Zn-dependent M28 family amino/carboxypeptidase
MPFTPPTPPEGHVAPLLDGGTGSAVDFARLGSRVRGAFVLIETRELTDLGGLFREYADAHAIDTRALAGEAAGVVVMASRPGDVLYRHLPSASVENTLTQIILERDAAERALRLLRAGRQLTLRAQVDAETGGPYESRNVIGEILGGERPEDIVLVGAHLDSWDLGTGALDNGCNVAMLIDIARQIRRLGLTPRRTIRFALWNGEEQGILGSWGYVRTHADELDRHVMAASFDLGSGRIDGFFTNGRAELVEFVDRALAPVAGLGPFTQVNAPIVGTDNFDFMLEGVANLVASQESANYGPNYHARSDTFEEVDLRQMRANAAVAAALTWAFADGEETWGRHDRAQVEALMEESTLKDQMQAMGFGFWEQWTSGERGRQP